MALNEIPVLDESWPLFDWADWQSSKDALVPGTPTRYFAKEAWNAIVDSLAEALEAAGLEWIGGYTDTPEETKITTPYGKLSARKFNSVMCNIDRPAPLGWAWESNPDFRGYRGRMHLWGPSASIEGVDKVYPEYILELVRKLNVLLEIMRGTAMLEEVELMHNASLLLDVEAVAGIGASAETEQKCSTQVSVDVKSALGMQLEAEHNASSCVSVEVEQAKALPMSCDVNIPVQVKIEGTAKPGVPLEPEKLLLSSLVSVEVEATRCVEMEIGQNSASTVQVESEMGQAQPMASEILSETLIEAELVQVEALPIEPIHVHSSTLVKAELVQRPPLAIESKVISGTQMEVSVDCMQTVSAEVASLSASLVSCEVGTAWLPPVWVNGGLWIRQAHTINVREDGSLEVL